jgi:hypothetical protein
MVSLARWLFNNNNNNNNCIYIVQKFYISTQMCITNNKLQFIKIYIYINNTNKIKIP